MSPSIANLTSFRLGKWAFIANFGTMSYSTYALNFHVYVHTFYWQ